MNTTADLDAADPLSRFRERFVITDDTLIYLDGNSLGRMPKAAAEVADTVVNVEWGDGLVRSWHRWIDLPARLGALVAPLVGASEDEVVLCDQTSLNLYKLASAAVSASRPDIVTDTTNFPSDVYVLRQIAEAAGGRLRLVKTSELTRPTVDKLAPHLDESVGLVSVSHVAFKSGAITDLAEVTELAHRHGVLTLFDLSHSVGAIAIDLSGSGTDLAIGCTYKHCNGGPGAPAFLFVRRNHHERLLQPIPGWWGHDAMFAFSTDYQPAPDIRRFLTGTPPVISMRVAEPGIAMVDEAGIDAIRAKGIVLGELLNDGYQRTLANLGFAFGSPGGAVNRGHHLALRHPEAYRITQALIARNVIPDFRAPDNIRLGVSPLYQRPSEMVRTIDTLAKVIRTEAYRDIDPNQTRVT